MILEPLKSKNRGYEPEHTGVQDFVHSSVTMVAESCGLCSSPGPDHLE
jgi:hypothetical protein